MSTPENFRCKRFLLRFYFFMFSSAVVLSLLLPYMQGISAAIPTCARRRSGPLAATGSCGDTRKGWRCFTALVELAGWIPGTAGGQCDRPVPSPGASSPPAPGPAHLDAWQCLYNVWQGRPRASLHRKGMNYWKFLCAMWGAGRAGGGWGMAAEGGGGSVAPWGGIWYAKPQPQPHMVTVPMKGSRSVCDSPDGVSSL